MQPEVGAASRVEHTPRGVLLVGTTSRGINRLLHRFRGVEVITSALHAEGPQFDPGRNHFAQARLLT